MKKYNPEKIEKYWQRYWEAKKFYAAPDNAKGKENFYLLVEFPYPSGNLHIGHWYTFSVSDIAARYWRMKGKNLMYPIGFDAFGLPAENAAIKNNLQPEDWTKKNIAHMTKQLKSMGAVFDWSRMVSTIDPDYYKWTQWIFLQFYKKGLAYRAKTLVNWCPKDQTVLANEQVINGLCDRCTTEVVQKELTQWMYKITDYADRLIDDLEKVDWPEVTKIAQRNWIGRSRGAEIDFLLPNSTETIKVFTTRADTLFGATYLVLAPEHPLVTKLTKDQYLNSVGKYLEEVKKKSELERTSLEKDKTGVFTGAYAVNPINNERIPIWVADYVLGQYGTGAVMAVPAHDERDFEFVQKYELPIRKVIQVKNNPKIKNCVMIHGCPSRMEHVVDVTQMNAKHWFPWVKEQLETAGIKVYTPMMSESWTPSYEAWKKEFMKLDIGPDSVLIGHSCGCSFLVRWLGETKRHIKKLILVAPAKIPAANANESLKEFFNFETDKTIRDRVEEIVIFVSDDEIERRRKSAKTYAEEFAARLIELKNKGHFTFEGLGGKEFPELIKEFFSTRSATIEDGVLINSAEFNGFKSEDAREEIVEKLAAKKLARRKVHYKLHDWVLSRQRYWGTPIPMINCPKCGYQPVSEKDLPVKLPKLEDYKPSADGRSPLAKAKSWLKAKCPHCGKEGERETDTMDTFVDSSWYFLRYTDPKNKKEFASPEKMKEWLPADLYIGGAEHNTMHLLYSRFFTKALHDLGFLDFDEAFTVRRNRGDILGPDGFKMSKSRGNVVDPDDLVEKYGADTVRMYLAFMGPYEHGGPWNPTGINGVSRFLNRVWNLFQQIRNPKSEIRNKSKIQNLKKLETRNWKLETFVNKTIKKIGEDIENLRFNTGVSELMKLLNEFESSVSSGHQPSVVSHQLFLQLLAPFAPHLAEELWQNVLGYKKSIHLEKWPEYDLALIREKIVKLVVQVNGKMRDVIILPADSDEAFAREAALVSEKVKKHLAGKEIRKFIYIKNRLINIVI